MLSGCCEKLRINSNNVEKMRCCQHFLVVNATKVRYAYGIPCFIWILALFLWDALFCAGFGTMPMGCPVLCGIWHCSYGMPCFICFIRNLAFFLWRCLLRPFFAMGTLENFDDVYDVKCVHVDHFWPSGIPRFCFLFFGFLLPRKFLSFL